MLSILKPVGECYIFSPYMSIYGIDESTTPFKRIDLNLGVLLFSTFNAGSTLEGRIDTSPSAFLNGENDCFHRNYEGTIIPKGQLRPVTSVVSDTTITSRYDSSRKATFDCVYPSRSITVYPGNLGVLYNQFAQYERPYNFDYRYPTTFTNSGYSKHTYTSLLGVGVSTRYGYIIAISRERWIDYHNDYLVTDVYGCIMEYSPYQGYRYRKFSTTNNVFKNFESSRELGDYVTRLPSCTQPLTGAYSRSDQSGLLRCVGETPLSSSIQDDRLFQRIMSSAVDTLLDPILPNWAEMSYDCIKQVRPWNGNGLAYSKDLITFGKSVSDAIRLLSNLKDPSNWASVILSTEYGIPQTYRDTKELLRSISAYEQLQGPRKFSSSRVLVDGWVKHEYHYGIYISCMESYLKSLSIKLNEFDLLPTTENLWDLIPFSFVVDWFWDVGNLLDHYDMSQELMHYDLLGSIYSIKSSLACPTSHLGFDEYEGNITLTKYTRVTSSTVLSPPVTKDVLNTNSFDHWIDGGALIIQKISH